MAKSKKVNGVDADSISMDGAKNAKGAQDNKPQLTSEQMKAAQEFVNSLPKFGDAEQELRSADAKLLDVTLSMAKSSLEADIPLNKFFSVKVEHPISGELSTPQEIMQELGTPAAASSVAEYRTVVSNLVLVENGISIADISDAYGNGAFAKQTLINAGKVAKNNPTMPPLEIFDDIRKGKDSRYTKAALNAAKPSKPKTSVVVKGTEDEVKLWEAQFAGASHIMAHILRTMEEMESYKPILTLMSTWDIPISEAADVLRSTFEPDEDELENDTIDIDLDDIDLDDIDLDDDDIDLDMEVDKFLDDDDDEL